MLRACPPRQNDEETDWIYLDNASTSHPKPACVWEAARYYIEQVGASPGRSSSALGRAAARSTDATRAAVADLLNVADTRTIFFAANATHGLNLIIKGLLRPGDHVVSTSSEHNSVLRPLEQLRRSGMIEWTVVHADQCGDIDPDDLGRAVRSKTRVVVVNHGSNVIGAIAPLSQIARIVHECDSLLLVDASQTAGSVTVDVVRDDIDFLAFTGHKALLGPSGVGGGYIRNAEFVRPLYEGGTGTNSQSLRHPQGLPDKYEAGTPNYLGIAGLGASLDYLRHRGLENVWEVERMLTTTCLEGLQAIKRVHVYGPPPHRDRCPVVSFNIDGLYPSETAHLLEKRFHLISRPGLQCAPLMHRSLGTFPYGTVRVSFGHTTREGEIARLLDAVERIASHPTAR